VARQHLNPQIPDRMGVVLKVKDNKISFNVEDRIGIKLLVDWVKGKGYEKLILPIRTPQEINHPQDVPHKKVLKQLNKLFGWRNIFLFIQDPWPDPLKKFDMDDKTFVVRFTYDEGCEMDRTWREWETESGYYMLTRDEVVKL
tara:strand:- start:1001 stop:1429 length:429 start_codon:yes stop_codon:yes gene_type:complete